MPHLLIIGGSDAGISAALRAKELAPHTEVTVVVGDRYPNYSICGLPFYLSGEVSDWQQLAHRTADEIRAKGIQLLLEHTAQAIDPAQKQVTVTDATGLTRQLPYDRLMLATGAASNRPPIQGIEQPGVYLLRWMADSFMMQRHLTQGSPQSVVIVGSGYIGVEMADALTLRGLSVTLVGRSESVLKTVDPNLGQFVHDELHRHGVEVVNQVTIDRIEPQGEQLRVFGSAGFCRVADLVLVAAGAKPATTLATSAGIERGIQGAIKVNRQMQTNVPDIYAAGDCVETWHHLLHTYTYLPLGTTAHKQGRIAGENAVGGQRTFAGSLGTQVVKVFDLAIARTGLREEEAKAAGFDPLTVETQLWDHKAYYPGAQPLWIRVTGDRQSQRLLGAQMVGHYQSEVAKRIDIFAAALFNMMTVEALNDLDLSYTPPLSSPWDAVQMSAQAWLQQAGGRVMAPSLSPASSM